ncbi:hypothetical protein BH24BAC1_BH24BAC1_20920 [soil metagenome]
MKWTLSVLLILFGFLNKCSEEVTGQELVRVHLGQEFTLEINRTAGLSVPANGQAADLKVHFGQLQDSRCPTDVNCITAGSAEITLTFHHPGGQSQVVSLCLGECAAGPGSARGFRQEDKAEVPVGNETYDVLLKEVSPYPSGNQESAEQKKKRAVLLITRK